VRVDGPRPLLSPEVAITAAAEAVLGGVPVGLRRLDGGMNNVMYRLDQGGRALVAKHYFQHPSDPRDRLGTEFQMVSFLWDSGTRCIPEPVGLDRTYGVGFYSYIDGARLSEGPVVERDLEAYGQFVSSMWQLSHGPGAEALPRASEAAFTLRDRLETVSRRLTWLRDALDPTALQARSFVAEEAVPLFDRLGLWAQDVAETAGFEIGEPAPEAEWALSQGDIGFHNCLRRGNRLVFLDFEYGGWDDVAQVMVQTCLAPAIPAPERLHPPFLSGLVGRTCGSKFLALRVRLIYPVLAVKWSLIMLNELVEVGRARRSFAGATFDEVEGSRVYRARGMLELAERSIDPRSPLSVLLTNQGGRS